MDRNAVIILAGGPKQNECWWPSYFKHDAGVRHSLYVVHRDHQHLPANLRTRLGHVAFMNKIVNGQDVPHAAFGGYRWAAQQIWDGYDNIAFVSDDVVVQRDGWLRDSFDLLNTHEKLGFVGTQIFNGNRQQYPHASHMRAPIWFAKTKALKEIAWEFDSDHDGEMRIADQFVAAGYFGAQVGCKFDVAYDEFQPGHISVDLAQWYYTKIGGTTEAASPFFAHIRDNGDKAWLNTETVTSRFGHIGERKIIHQLEPFHGLVYDKSVSIARECGVGRDTRFGAYVL